MVVLHEVRGDAVAPRATSARKVSTKKPRSSPCTVGARQTSPSSRVSSRCICGEEVRERPSKDRLAMPRTATMPPAARGHQTLSTYISARFEEFSRSQKDVAQYVVDHLDEVAFHTAEELARRANTSSSTVVRFSQALGFEGFPELQEAAREEYRHHHRTAKTPEHGDAAVQPRPVTVRAGRRRRSRQRRGHGAARQPLRGRRRDRGDRRRREDPDRRHGPDGVLRLLSAPPADAARRPRRDRRQSRPRKRSPGSAGSTSARW